MNEIIEQHRSHGPHIQLSDAVVFLTWRLAFTLPKHLAELYNEFSAPDEENHPNLESIKRNDINLFNRFCKYDEALAMHTVPGISLNEPIYAEIIKETLHYYDTQTYELHAFCIMSNHLHMLLKPLKDESRDYYRVSIVVQKVKSYTSKRINEQLGTQGQIWDRYYFDRIIRDQSDYIKVVEYIINNPVKAGLVDNPKNWKDSYFKDSFSSE